MARRSIAILLFAALMWLSGCGGDGSGTDSSGPTVLSPGVTAPAGSDGGTVLIYANVGDPSGIRSVIATVTKPDGSTSSLGMSRNGSAYRTTYEAGANSGESPATYYVLIVARDLSDNLTSVRVSFQVPGKAEAEWITTASGLSYRDTTVGTGAEAASHQNVTVNYTGTLDDGTVFDSSLDPGRDPFTFPLGAGNVIKGWDEGVVGMKVGGTRQLIIPPELGYGDRVQDKIPANSTLHFDVELLSVGE